MSSDIKRAVDTMADYFLANTRAEKVFREFPRPDQKLVTPSISIQTVRTDSIPRMEQTIGNTGLGLDITQVGEYMMQLKFDLWGKYKTERDGLYQDIRDIFRIDTIQLEMGGDANPIMQLFMKSLNYLDSPEYAASGVWRTNLEMEAHFDRLIVDDLPSMEEIVTMDDIGS